MDVVVDDLGQAEAHQGTRERGGVVGREPAERRPRAGRRGKMSGNLVGCGLLAHAEEQAADVEEERVGFERFR